MERQQLISLIRKKKSYLCVGLDTDPQKIPAHLFDEPEPVLAFNRQIIEATKDFAAAYKINTAFYEAIGARGWRLLEKTVEMLPKDVFIIADAKRGDIGNTSERYATAFFDTLKCHAVTVAPYMGQDSIQPFMRDTSHWTILLLLTSNTGSSDLQQLPINGQPLWQHLLQLSQQWMGRQQLMYVVGATHPEDLHTIRKLVPDSFLLVPGVGAQGGSLKDVSHAALTKDGGLLVNVSRSIIYASDGEDFAEAAGRTAKEYQQEMQGYLDNLQG